MPVRIRERMSLEVSALTPETEVGRQSSDRWRRCSKRRAGGKIDVRGGSWRSCAWVNSHIVYQRK